MTDLVGAWKLREFRETTADGQLFEPLGAAPMGLVLYSADGVMSGQLCRADGSDYVAYAGRYVIEDDMVAHHVLCSLHTPWVGTTLRRGYEFDGAELVLRPLEPRPDGRHSTALRWTRCTGADLLKCADSETR
jgi:hypothetical protein